MPDKDFNWWELLGTGAGMAVGGTAGFLLGGPGGAVAGAGLGASIGQQISPGGFWTEGQTAATPLLQPESAGVTAAALKEMEAARNMMRQEIGTGIQGIRQRFGQAGTFQSGARGRAEDVARQQGLRSLSGAFAGIELEAVRARQQGAATNLALQMQEAQMLWQKEMQENAMITSLITTALPFFMKSGQTDPSLSLDPRSPQDRIDIWEELGLDPFIMESGGGQSPWQRVQ